MSGAPEIEPSWRAELADELAADYFRSLCAFVARARAEGEVYPPAEDVFRAFALTPFGRVRVVILGQDPYHEPGQARGLAFDVPPGARMPPSLANIARELSAEFPDAAPGMRPDLASWAGQGVLLLNATLTVAAHRPLSHRGRGWERFTDAAVRRLAARREGLAFLLWGASARAKAPLIDPSRHLVLECAHPSPLSARRGFFGCGHFARANAYFASRGEPPVRWTV